MREKDRAGYHIRGDKIKKNIEWKSSMMSLKHLIVELNKRDHFRDLGKDKIILK
jgi:hypothetical protein